MKRKASLLLVLCLVFGLGIITTVAHMADVLSHQSLQVDEPQLLVVERGTSARRVLANMAEQGWIDHHLLTPYLVYLEAGWARIQAGTYRLMPGDDLATFWGRLMRGEQALVSVTLIEGSRVRDVLALLRSRDDISHTLAPDLTTEQLGALLQPAIAHAEGWLLPDTYHVVAGTPDVAVLQRAYDAMRQNLDGAWQQRASGLPYKDPYDSLIMASIIEKETAYAPERPLIGSVFVNRLRLGMRLQTDPTVIYGLGEHWNGNLTRDNLRDPTPYNTYTIDGLPPTPIALPSREALQAALNPQSSDYLYFVARGDGQHQFSRTLVEHNAAVRQFILGRP